MAFCFCAGAGGGAKTTKRKKPVTRGAKRGKKKQAEQVEEEEEEELEMSGEDSISELMEQANEELDRLTRSPRREGSSNRKENSDKRKKNKASRKSTVSSGSEDDAERGRRKKRERSRRKDSDTDSDADGSGRARKKKQRKEKASDSGTEKASRKKKNKRKAQSSSSSNSSDTDSDECFDNFTKLAGIWKYEARPRFMQKRSVVNAMEWKEIMDTKREYREECRQNGMGESAFAADAGIRTTKFPAAKDNRKDKLHPASLLRMPITDPAEYWRKIPVKREPVYRNIPLRHCNGNVVINELAIVRMHDRSATLTLRMFMDANFAKRPGKETGAMDLDWEAPTKLRAAQSAIYSYQAVLRALWPMDTTPEAIGQLLVKMDWGGSHRQDAARATLVEQFFNRAMMENAQLAVNRSAPADYRKENYGK